MQLQLRLNYQIFLIFRYYLLIRCISNLIGVFGEEKKYYNKCIYLLWDRILFQECENEKIFINRIKNIYYVEVICFSVEQIIKR